MGDRIVSKPGSRLTDLLVSQVRDDSGIGLSRSQKTALLTDERLRTQARNIANFVSTYGEFLCKVKYAEGREEKAKRKEESAAEDESRGLQTWRCDLYSIAEAFAEAGSYRRDAASKASTLVYTSGDLDNAVSKEQSKHAAEDYARAADLYVKLCDFPKAAEHMLNGLRAGFDAGLDKDKLRQDVEAAIGYAGRIEDSDDSGSRAYIFSDLASYSKELEMNPELTTSLQTKHIEYGRKKALGGGYGNSESSIVAALESLLMQAEVYGLTEAADKLRKDYAAHYAKLAVEGRNAEDGIGRVHRCAETAEERGDPRLAEMLRTEARRLGTKAEIPESVETAVAETPRRGLLAMLGLARK